MIENYKGWNITLNWNENSFYIGKSDQGTSAKAKEKWEGVNLNGKKIYGATLKEIRHIIDYPALYK